MNFPKNTNRFLLLSLLTIALLATPASTQAYETPTRPSAYTDETTQILPSEGSTEHGTPGSESSTESQKSTEATTEAQESTDTSTETQDPTRGTTEEQKPSEATTEEPEPVVVKTAKITGDSSYTVKYVSGKTIDLGLTTNSDGLFSYSTSDQSVALVTQAGTVQLKGTGTCTITAKCSATDNYTSVTKDITIKCYKSPVKLGYSSSYKKSKYYSKLKKLKLFGDTRSNLLTVATSQIGYHESSSKSSLSGSSSAGGNCTEYGRFYGYNGVAWCAIFVNWVARENGLSYSRFPKHCAVCNYYAFFRRRGFMHSWYSVRKGSYTPKKGDIIFYSNVRGSTTHHIGYVESVTSSSGKVLIKTIEGNTHNAVRRVTMNMSRSNSSGKVNGHYITGFASPNY